MNPFCQSGGQKDEPTLILPPIAHVQQKRVQNAMHDPEVKGTEVLRRLVGGQELEQSPVCKDFKGRANVRNAYSSSKCQKMRGYLRSSSPETGLHQHV